MSIVEFKVPLHVEDLALDLDDRYTLHDRVGPPAHHTKQILADVEVRLTNDPTNIYAHEAFDSLYWLVCGCGAMPAADRRLLMSILCTSLVSLVGSINSVVMDRDVDLDSVENRERVDIVRNALKMHSYLLSTAVSRMYRDVVQPTKSKGSKSKNAEDNWDVLKEKVTSAFLEMIDHKALKRLWTGEPEEEFGALLFQVGIQLMEDKDNAAVRNAALRNCMFSLVSRSMTTFTLDAQAIAGLVQLVLSSEHAATLVAAFLQHSLADFSSPPFAIGVLDEIGRLDSKQLSRDLLSCKCISTFLVEIATRMPAEVVQSLPVVLPFIDAEHYALRNGIIKMLGTLLLNNDDEVMPTELRAAIIHTLVQRFLDSSSYSRSAALATWRMLAEAERIPLQVLDDVMAGAAERLLDKSVFVRKAAIQFFTTILQHNPFAAQLDGRQFAAKMDDVVAQIGALKEKLDASGEERVGGDDEDDMVIEGNRPTLELESQLNAANHEVSQLKIGLQFCQRIEVVISTMISLLSSKSVSDALSAIEFIVAAHEFGIAGSTNALHKMLPLVYSKQADVKDAIVAVYDRVYVKGRPSTDVAAGLVNLAVRTTVTELTCLEVIVSDLVRAGSITVAHVSSLVRVLSDPSSSLTQARAALDLLAMAGLSLPDVIHRNLDQILSRSFKSHTDSALVRSACIALQRMAPNAIPADSPAFGHLRSVLEAKVGMGPHWFSAAQQAMDAVFKLHPCPDAVISDVLNLYAQRVFGELLGDATQLSQLFFLVGHAAIRMLVYHEELEASWKRTRNSHQDREDVTIEEDDELAAVGGGQADELEVEVLKERAQAGLLDPNSIVGAIAPLLVNVIGNPSQYSDQVLQMSASLALCKIMCVSASFCEQHLRLLFTLLQRAECPNIRANLVIALGDLAFRFPNLIDPWTSHMYAPLKDGVPRVRKNTLMVLSHLILNDMIKVKGEISAVTLCLDDPESSIKDLAHLFFTELSKKVNNPIYNVLPDTISRLSRVESVDPDVFKRISKYLIEFVDKERQIESLVEKFCHRFPTTEDAQHWRNYAYCLSCLNITSSKIVAKFMSLVKLYSDKLDDDEVFNLLRGIIVKAKKAAEGEFLEQLEEFDRRMTSLHAPAADDADADERPAAGGEGSDKEQQQEPLRRARKPRGKKAVHSSDGDDSAAAPAKTPRARRAASARPAVPPAKENVPDDNDDDVFAPPKTPKRSSTSTRRAAAAAAPSSSRRRPAPKTSKPPACRRARKPAVQSSSSSSSSDGDLDNVPDIPI
ncbi:non-SMC mitotic condensation complex subunit 1, N-term [Plasmodiophora brassicae]